MIDIEVFQMIRVVYKITGEYDDYSTFVMNETDYNVINKFVQQINEDSNSIQITEINKESF